MALGWQCRFRTLVLTIKSSTFHVRVIQPSSAVIQEKTVGSSHHGWMCLGATSPRLLCWPQPSTSTACPSCVLNPTFIPHQLTWNMLQQGCESRWTDSHVQLNSRWMWTFYLASCPQVPFLTLGWCRISRNSCSLTLIYATGR